MLSFQKFIKSAMFYIFVEIREMSGNFSNLANLYRIYNVLPVSSASAERSSSRLKQKPKHAQQRMRSDCRPCLCYIVNTDNEFTENLDFNSVIDTFAKMKNRSKQLVGL